MADFTKEAGYIMSAQEKKELIDNYLESAGEGAPRSEFFGKKFLKRLMRECKGEAAGIWIQYGRDVNGLRIVLSPADCNGKMLELITDNGGLKDEPPATGGGGSATRCPNSCP